MNGFAISFDMDIALLKEHYGEPYNPAYAEIRSSLTNDGFFWFQGSTYMSGSTDMVILVRAITNLKKLDWFRKSVRDIRAFKVQDWSDFTNFVKNE